MRRFLTQLLASVGVLTALAVLDLGPRASAAYLSTASRSVGSSTATETPPPEAPAPHAERQRDGLPSNEVLTGGGMTGSNSNPPGSSTLVAELPPRESPTDCLVVYLREPVVRLKCSKFIESLLDPPRLA